ncbi:TauD/TfdA family dioxygenase [Streptomyces sp. NPDC058297]|uniref:TauD/TfdA family dioxygenase n=1 Tax=Streptomyces sp. NPDC058297 TaxID=3346433 RepID=UPI0036EFB720
MALKITPLTGSIGASVEGVRLGWRLDDATLTTLREAFLEYSLLVFRGQHLEAPAHAEFARHWGEPVVTAMLDQLPDAPGVVQITDVKKEATATEAWRYDATFEKVPPKISIRPWFQTHFDRFVVPPGAEELARSAVGPQAFRTGRSLGVQFHPELTEATLRRWLDLGLYDQARGLGLDPDELLDRTRELREEARRRAHALVDGFLDRVARSPAATGAEPAAATGAEPAAATGAVPGACNPG